MKAGGKADGVRFQIGTDVGGTFTDLWIRSSDNRTGLFKHPTSKDVVTGVIGALQLAADAFELDIGALCARIDRFGHGTTRGLNALLTRNGAKTAVITTRGFGDTMEIGRMRRQYAGLSEIEVADYMLRGRSLPLVARADVFEVGERVDCNGEVVVPLDAEELGRVIDVLEERGYEAVAVCTLWATRNAKHEKAILAAIRARLPKVFACASSEISPSEGEYARMVTTAANAMLGPVMGAYFNDLQSRLQKLGLRNSVMAMTSAGGVAPTSYLAERPVSALFSGPAAGVVGSSILGAESGFKNILVMDVGGTSFDVGLIVDGGATLRSQTTVVGADIRFPTIDVASIGTGGGSLVSARLGSLQVGPQSAGAEPGPACYGRGGERPTATDADLVLNLLDPERFNDGRMKLDRAAAEAAIKKHVADPLGMSVVEAALGIRRIQDAKMADLVRRVTIERGYDPRDYTMFACGGAGPLHAWALCQELSMPRFVVPATATGQSAFGTGVCDVRRTSERTVNLIVPPGAPVTAEQIDTLRSVMSDLEESVRRELSRDIDPSLIRSECTLALHFKGQSHALDVPIGQDDLDPDRIQAVLSRFEAKYEGMFGKGSAFTAAGFELIHLRCEGIGTLPKLAFDNKKAGVKFERVGQRKIIMRRADEPIVCDIWRSPHPLPGEQVRGPAIIELRGTSIVVPPDATARTDASSNVIVEFAAAPS